MCILCIVCYLLPFGVINDDDNAGPAPAAEKTPAATASEAKPAAAAPASNPDPPKPSKTEAPNPSPTSGSTFQGKGDDFYNTIFYFSGMGSVIGSALAQGVYVSEQNRRNAIDPDDVGRKVG